MNNRVNRPVWVEVDLEKIKYNFKKIKENVSRETLIMAVVKANAYGHGVIPVVKKLITAGCDRLAVALPEEGKQIREAGFDQIPIHILGEVLPHQISMLFDNNLIPTISKLKTIKEINSIAKKKELKKKVHIKIDTGMGRIGIFPKDVLEFINEIKNLSNIQIEGLMTHFANADEKDKEYTRKQWNEFVNIISLLENNNIKIPLKHVANSATIMDLPEMELDMVRPGIMLYGLNPSSEINSNLKLKSALSWKARIMYLKEVSAGSGISYGTTFVTSKRSKIATLPLGYADGYSRLLSNKAEVLIQGKRVPVVGNVCMDQFMVDVSEIKDVNIGDEVVLIGKQKNEEIKATELAEIMGTINYEIVCNISDRIPRKYV